jgi:hypothetical protein
MESEYKVITEKDGLKFSRLGNHEYHLQFMIQNNHIHLPSIIHFDLVKLIYDLNGDIYEKVVLEKINEKEATITLLMKHFFVDMGLPQRYGYLHVSKEIGENRIDFLTTPILSEKPESIPDEAQMIPLKSTKLLCEILNDHKVNLHCFISFNEHSIIPPFMEKFFGLIFNKIFNRVKQFIENYRI